MTRIVFVHGIHQQGKSTESLRAEWLEALEPALASAGYAGPALVPDVPFYGDRLWELADRRGGPAVAQGAGEMPSDEAEFLARSLDEVVEKVDMVDESAVQAEEEKLSLAVDQGIFGMSRRANAIARVIEAVSPLHGDVALRVLHQAWVYLRKPGAAEEIDAIVAPHFKEGPCIVVAHSLGTIVSFKLLRRLALQGQPLDVPLFVTLGSPLSLRAVRGALGPAFAPPKGIGRWLNAYDVDDFVSLGQGLTRGTFAEGIENWGEVENLKDDPHAIKGYLGDAKVAGALLKVLQAQG